jgi:hypothetical protein
VRGTSEGWPRKLRQLAEILGEPIPAPREETSQ